MTDSRVHRVHAEVLAAINPDRQVYRVHAEVLWGPGISTGPTITWWDGAAERTATLDGWWDGAAERPLTVGGWWDGAAERPLA